MTNDNKVPMTDRMANIIRGVADAKSNESGAESANLGGLLYADRDIELLDKCGDFHFKHLIAMTGEKLHNKSAIAAELGWRDMELDNLWEEIRMLRCLEDSYDTQEEVIAEVFLKLNELCGV